MQKMISKRDIGGPLKKSLMILSLSAVLVGAASAPLQAQASKGETGLVGVKLFDTGMDLLRIYGNPDQMLPIGVAVGQAPRTGRGIPNVPPPGSGQPAPGGDAGGRPAELGTQANNAPAGTFGFGDEILSFQGPRRGSQGGGGGGGSAFGTGADGDPGRPAGGGGNTGTAAPGQAPAGRGSATTTVPRGNTGLPWIRWVYKRNGCYYGFILDNNNRVVQIEAIGLQNNKVRTRRGVEFGDTFKDVMMKYNTPEGYQVNGDTIVMRYLTREKVAFRLNRLGADKPHVVTAIVIAAGKV